MSDLRAEALRTAAALPVGSAKRRALLAALKESGTSYGVALMWFSFVGNKTPFNVDTIADINHTWLEIVSAEGVETTAPLKFVRAEHSPPLTFYQEKAGEQREIVFLVQYPDGYADEAAAAIIKLGKLAKFKVSVLAKPRAPQTKKKAGGHDIMDLIVPTRDVMKLMSAMRKEKDEQSADLVYEVYSKLSDKFDLSSNESGALNRLKGSISRIGSWDAGTQRNNIFKAADLLGMKLPSMMFASDHTASGLTPQVIAQIAEMTDQNDHGGAVALLAKSLGETKTVKVMEHVRAIHHVLGGMPHDLITFRNSLLAELLKQAKSKLDADAYKQLHMSF